MVGLIMKQAHVFLTNTSQYFYLPKSFDQLQRLVYACYDGNLTRTYHKCRKSQNAQFALHANKP